MLGELTTLPRISEVKKRGGAEQVELGYRVKLSRLLHKRTGVWVSQGTIGRLGLL